MADTNPAWVRAALPLCLLGALRHEESYGYALLQQLTAAGLESVKPATLYPALTRLAEEGAVEVNWRAGEGGPGRKCYRITPAGLDRLEAEWAAWRGFGAAVSRLVAADTAPPPASDGTAGSDRTGEADGGGDTDRAARSARSDRSDRAGGAGEDGAAGAGAAAGDGAGGADGAGGLGDRAVAAGASGTGPGT
ncbi:PadR family transcriptional regulator [Streptomyces cacaoi]|uniref:PadR family transcriptional regulator n=1 Tax=Streptomyces cacaoi TaxID=1898 RepID=UPI002604A758|nr:PadR family transcriptional regulator [Streptomyces cacaoi]